MVNNLDDFLRWEEISDDNIKVKRIYVDIAGDLVSGVLLSQIVYWHLPSKKNTTKLRVQKEDRFWLAKGRNDWWEECRISPKQFDRAVEKLRSIGVVDTKLFRFNGSPMVHICLNGAILMGMVNSILTKGENPTIPKVEIQLDETLKTLTKTTAKTTAKNKTIADTKTVSAHKQIIDHYHNKFLAKYEVKPFINGKTGKDVKSLLSNNAELDAQKVIILLDRYFDDNDDFIVKNRHSFSVFMSRINQLNTVNNTPKQSTSSQDRGGCYRIIGDNDPDYQAWLAMQEGE